MRKYKMFLYPAMVHILLTLVSPEIGYTRNRPSLRRHITKSIEKEIIKRSTKQPSFANSPNQSDFRGFSRQSGFENFFQWPQYELSKLKPPWFPLENLNLGSAPGIIVSKEVLLKPLKETLICPKVKLTLDHRVEVRDGQGCEHEIIAVLEKDQQVWINLDKYRYLRRECNSWLELFNSETSDTVTGWISAQNLRYGNMSCTSR